MSSIESTRRLVNRRSAITAAGAGVTALGMSRWPTAAQDVDPAAMATYPIVGVWVEEFDANQNIAPTAP